MKPALFACAAVLSLTARAAPAVAPRFEADLTWPKPLPNHWILGQAIGVAVDAQDHIWIIHRPGSLEPNETHAAAKPPIAQCCAPAPPVLEFDQQGNLLRHWGGPGEGYDWPLSNHGITIDYKGNVWIGGNSREPIPGHTPAAGAFESYHDDMVLKFTQDGKFLLQIGKPWQSKGSNDTANLRLPAKTFVDPKTNELYVADGYANHRVIVFDADTGRYKRHWGAYGHRPDDTSAGPYAPDASPAQQFRNPVHCAMVSNDGLVYVCDRANDRIQVFRPDGTFVKEAFIENATRGSGAVWDIAFSGDPEQKFIYLADGENDQVHILDRQSLEVLTSFGQGGRQPGEFYGVHSIATDSHGNIYTTETWRGQRLQRFLYKGVAPVTTKDQGAPWPKTTCTGCSASYIPAAELSAYLDRAPALAVERGVSDQQARAVDIGKANLDVGVVYRPKLTARSPVAEHDLVSEVYYIMDGEADLVTGSDVEGVERRPSTNNNVRNLNGPGSNGTSIRGGVTHHLKPGDVIVVPAGVGHWFTRIDNHIRYLIVRIDPDKVTPLKDEAASKTDLAGR